MKKSKKQEDALKKASIQRLHVEDFAELDGSLAPIDIYIRLPKNRRLVLWIEQGEVFSKKELDKIRDHSDPYIYTVETSLFWGERPGRVKYEDVPHIDQQNLEDRKYVPEKSAGKNAATPVAQAKTDATKTNAAKNESPSTSKKSVVPIADTTSSKKSMGHLVDNVDFQATHQEPVVTTQASSKKSIAVGEPILDHQASGLVKAAQPGFEQLLEIENKAQREIQENSVAPIDAKAVESRLWSLFQPTLTRQKNTGLSDLHRIGEEIVPMISDDARRFMTMIGQNSRYAQQLQDSLSIYAIGTLFFLANGYTLRGILEELAYAVLFMDLPLVELGDATLKTYYTDFAALGPLDKKSVHEHPSVAHKSAREKLKKASQNCLRMIEGHHEYANGNGFPRSIRNENLPPLVRILSYAVLVFEAMKTAELKGQNLGFHAAVTAAAEPEKAPGERRAHSTTVQTIRDFLDSKTRGQSDQAA